MKYKPRKLAAGVFVAVVLITSDTFAEFKLDDTTIFAIFDETNTADAWAEWIAVKNAHSEDLRESGKIVVNGWCSSQPAHQ